MTVRVVAGLLLVAALGTLAVFGVNEMGRVRAMQREIETLEREVGTLRDSTRRLAEDVDRLRNDPAYLEKLAREELGLVKEGDTVLKFPSERSRAGERR